MSPTNIIYVFNNYEDHSNEVDILRHRLYGGIGAIFTTARLRAQIEEIEQSISTLDVEDSQKVLILQERALSILSQVFIPKKMFELDAPESASAEELKMFEAKQAAVTPLWNCSARTNIVASQRWIVDGVYQEGQLEKDRLFWEATPEEQKKVLVDIGADCFGLNVRDQVMREFREEITAKTTPEMFKDIINNRRMSEPCEAALLAMYCHKRWEAIGGIGMRTVKVLIPQETSTREYQTVPTSAISTVTEEDSETHYVWEQDHQFRSIKYKEIADPHIGRRTSFFHRGANGTFHQRVHRSYPRTREFQPPNRTTCALTASSSHYTRNCRASVPF